MSAAMSPDRRWIAIDLVGRLWILPARGGEAKPITPLLLEARQPTWSPDSESIAFQGYDDGAWHIYVVPREGGEPRALTGGEFDDREPAWAHRGTRIAFSSDRVAGITTCWEVDAAGGEVRPLSGRDGWMPSWSPNDEEITIVSQDLVNRDGDPVSETARRPGLCGVGPERDRLLVDATARLRPGQAAALPT